MKKPVFVINVELDECSKVSNTSEQVNFIRFHGTSDSDYFQGDILTGGVDCQRKKENEPLKLSARYIMEGTDCAGSKCSVFIENNGYDMSDGPRTVPTIITDSEILSGLTRGNLYGKVSGKGGSAVEIRIYKEACWVTMRLKSGFMKRHALSEGKCFASNRVKRRYTVNFTDRVKERTIQF